MVCRQLSARCRCCAPKPVVLLHIRLGERCTDSDSLFTAKECSVRSRKEWCLSMFLLSNVKLRRYIYCIKRWTGDLPIVVKYRKSVQTALPFAFANYWYFEWSLFKTRNCINRWCFTDLLIVETKGVSNMDICVSQVVIIYEYFMH